MMDEAHKSLRKLSDESYLSPTVIQNIRSAAQEDIQLSNFINISHACGYMLDFEDPLEPASVILQDFHLGLRGTSTV